jgi:outer membrane protein insertion porin family
VDLVYNVTEKPTGSISLGAGFSSTEKLALTFGIAQENAFGTGQYLAINLNTSKYNRTAVVSNTNPYFTASGISRTVDVFHRTTRPYLTTVDNSTYSMVNQGVGLKFGLPVTEKDTVFVGANLERNEVNDGTYLPIKYEPYLGSRTAVPLTLGWARDGRDSALVPSKGTYQRVNADWSVAGDSRYIRSSYQFQQYFPITKKYTLAFNTELGWGKGLNGQTYPIFKNFYAGGLGSVRGFEQNSLGEQSDVTGQTNKVYVGGAKKLIFNAEFQTPFPGAGADKTLRLFAFTDFGNVYGENETMAFNKLRGSAGIGLSWISPVGPLRFSYGVPLRKEATDKIQKLQFQIGTAF